MSQFLTKLAATKVGFDRAGRPVWELRQPLVYDSARYGMQVVPEGFNTNFVSCPRWPIAFWLAGDRAHEAATLHDYHYTVHRTTREEADAIFLEALTAPLAIATELQNPVPPGLARLMYRAVRLGGQSSWDAPTLVPQPQRVQQYSKVDPAQAEAP